MTIPLHVGFTSKHVTWTENFPTDNETMHFFFFCFFGFSWSFKINAVILAIYINKAQPRSMQKHHNTHWKLCKPEIPNAKLQTASSSSWPPSPFLSSKIFLYQNINAQLELHSLLKSLFIYWTLCLITLPAFAGCDV